MGVFDKMKKRNTKKNTKNTKNRKKKQDKFRQPQMIIEDEDTYEDEVYDETDGFVDEYDDEYEDEDEYEYDEYEYDDDEYDDEYDDYASEYEHIAREEGINPVDIISGSRLETIRENLIQSHAGTVIEGMTDPEKRRELEDYIRKTFKHETRGYESVVKYIARETVGTGVIEDIIETDESITDIGYNGTHLIIESNDNKWIYDTDQDIDDRYIVRLVNKFARANGRDFTDKNPTFDGKYENIRVNAVYDTNTTSGVTMALRVVRPKLALTKDNFELFAPDYVYDLFQAGVGIQSNFVIAGETGTGKTELQKLLASFIPFDERIVLIEDTAETFLKEMFPDQDIFSWVTSADVSITQLIKASLRANPRWILVSETRGQEAYEMIQAVLSGHSIITTLHTAEARAIPTRLVNMAKMGYEFSEEGLTEDIRRYFDFGLHIMRDQYNGKTLRYLSELIYFQDDREDGDEGQIIFKQELNHQTGELVAQMGELPEALKRKLRRYGRIPETVEENVCHMRKYETLEEYDENKEAMKTKLSIINIGLMTEEQLDAFGTEEQIVDFSKLADAHGHEDLYADGEEDDDGFDDNVIDLNRSRTDNVYGADNKSTVDLALDKAQHSAIQLEGANGITKVNLSKPKSDPKGVKKRKISSQSPSDVQQRALDIANARKNRKGKQTAPKPNPQAPVQDDARAKANAVLARYNKKKDVQSSPLPKSTEQTVNRREG